MNKVYLDEMISGIKSWLVKHDYNYIECNDVPTCLYVDNQKINVLIRTFFRLCPINVRKMKLKEGQLFPITPQANVALLKAYSIPSAIFSIEETFFLSSSFSFKIAGLSIKNSFLLFKNTI